MNTYVVTTKVFLEIEATDQETAVALAEDAVKRTRFAVGHKMVSVKQLWPPQANTPEAADERA